MNKYKKQAETDKYYSTKYITPTRLSTYFEVLILTLQSKPKTILEFGPGNNIVSNILKTIGFSVHTADIDKKVEPDYLVSIADEKILLKINKKYDVVIASQILEHVRYKDFLKALGNIINITPKLIITLPYTNKNSIYFDFSFRVPILGRKWLSVKYIYKKIKYKFNGEHYWEIGTKSHPLGAVKKDIKDCGWYIKRSFINPQNPYHYILYLEKK